MFKCMQCNETMLKNTFICIVCERSNRQEKERVPQTIREQHVRSINMKEGSFDNEGSQYWDYVEKHGTRTPEGEAMETDRANPDYVSAKRLKEMERNSNPPINEMREKAKELLKEGAKTLTKRELDAVRDFAKDIPQKKTAERLGIAQKNVSVALKRGLNKLKSFTEDKL